MTILRAGTVTFTNGSTAVVGVGTFFTSLPNGAMIRKHNATGTQSPYWYSKLSHTTDTAMLLETPYAESTSGGGGDQYDALVFQEGTLAEAVNLFSSIMDRFSEIVSLNVSDRTLTLNRDASTDNAGVVIQTGDVDQFRFGAFGDNQFALLRKDGVAWTSVFTVDSTTGVLTFAAGAITSSLQPRNRMFNGAMRLSSTFGTATTDVNGTTTEVLDGWSVQTAGGGVLRAQQTSGPAPGGSPNWLRMLVQTVDASVAAGDLYRVFATIKGRDIADLKWGTAAAKPLTLAFSHNAGLAGVRCVSIRNAAGNRSLVKEFTVSAPQVGVDVQRSLTFAGDTSGTWLTTDADALIVTFDFGSGTNFNTTADTWSAGLYTRTVNQANVIGNASVADKISDVAWYVGSNAPTYENRSWLEDLLRGAIDYGSDLTTLSIKRHISTTGNIANTGTHIGTSASANALAIGRQGATNPALQVDASASSSVTGWALIAAAAAAGAFLTVISSGTNEPGVINAKGTGTLSMQTVATGNVVVGASKFTIAPASGNTAIAGTVAVADTTDATSTTAGSVTLAGGLAVLKTAYVGGNAVITGTLASAAHTITSASATALSVGRLGATTPALLVDASTATSITGISIKSAASGGGVAVAAIGETNVALTINGAGSGAIGIGSVSTGRVTITPVTTITGALTLSAVGLVYDGKTLTGTTGTASNMVLSASPTLTGTLTAAAANYSGAVTVASKLTAGGAGASAAKLEVYSSGSAVTSLGLYQGGVAEIGIGMKSGSGTLWFCSSGVPGTGTDYMSLSSATLAILPATASSSSTTGALTIGGGLGVVGAINAGSTLTLAGKLTVASGNMMVNTSSVVTGSAIEAVFASNTQSGISLTSNNASTTGELILIKSSAGVTAGTLTYTAAQAGILLTTTCDGDLKTHRSFLSPAAARAIIVDTPIRHFDWNGKNASGIGPFAQDVKKALPSAFFDKTPGTPGGKHWASAEYIPILIASNAAIYADIDRLSAEIMALKQRLNA